MDFTSDEYFMGEALKEAQKAFDQEEVPVGAVVVCREKIIARAHNQVETLVDPTAHAEMLAITAASNSLGAKYLNECSLYVTLEPCVMCAGASSWSQVGKVVFGALDIDRGYSVKGSNILHKKTEVVSGVLAEQSTALLKAFFQKLRD
ncbi:nucleoside deaminase [Cyclobacteriaceae bacterium]|nr:nucleoside deaminase [Cyclobacteriaceae bacterium]